MSFSRDVIFSTRIRVFRCRVTVFLVKRMSRSPSPSSSSESYYGYSEESEPESFPEKPLLEIGGYDYSVEPVPTEEEAAEYLEQLALEEEEEQTLLSRFSGEEDIRDWYVFRVMKYKNLRIERINV